MQIGEVLRFSELMHLEVLELKDWWKQFSETRHYANFKRLMASLKCKWQRSGTSHSPCKVASPESSRYPTLVQFSWNPQSFLKISKDSLRPLKILPSCSEIIKDSSMERVKMMFFIFLFEPASFFVWCERFHKYYRTQLTPFQSSEF